MAMKHPAPRLAAVLLALACSGDATAPDPAPPANRAPVARGEIPAQVVTEGAPVELDVSGYFEDPDGDSLTFAATSSNTAVVRVAVAGTVATLTAQTAGAAAVTVTARDPDGLEARAVFAVEGMENPDRPALAALYDATDGPNWLDNDGWLTDAPLGEWHGVRVHDGRLVSLWLHDNGLTGPIPLELGNLASLEALGLSDNDLTGPIPPELGGLASLESLYLGENGLTGSIPPELGNLASLKTLSLHHNDLTGPIPPELGSLASLEGLLLSGNGLTGPIPPELGSLASLEALWLSGNDLTGPIPPELGSLASLEGLLLSGNGLTGPIPPELGNLASLEALWLSGNDLTGPIPPELGNLASLESLLLRPGNPGLCAPDDPRLRAWLAELGANVIPCQNRAVYRAALAALYDATDGSNWTNNDGWLTDAPLGEWHGVEVRDGRLVSLGLGKNGLKGSIPPELGNLASLEGLFLYDNDLTGPIPPELGNLASLKMLWLSKNRPDARYYPTGGLTGSIPPELGGLASLEDLSLGHNDLTGPIPPELGGLASLETLSLHGNDLTGPIPPELGSLASLETLSLDDNALTGSIPPELGGLASLEDLSLDDNALTGPIPPELASLASLETLGLSSNDLTGPIPPELGSLASLEWLSLGHNDLTGPIPPELGSLASLKVLGLFFNDLTGPIPPELASLASLELLGLTGNPGLCASDDPRLRAWLAEVGANVIACLNRAVRLLPSALMRADGNGLSLALPDDFPAPAAVNVSDPSVVAASVADGWLELAPRSPGSADVEVVPAGGGPPAVASVVVRAGSGTFGIDIVVNQPAPIGYAEALTAAADWWSSALDGTEWTDRRVLDWCFDGLAATADELVIFADNVAEPGDRNRPEAFAWAWTCRPHVLAAGSGGVVLNVGSPHNVFLMLHEIGHVLGLVDVFRDGPETGLTTGDRAYWIGPRAVEAYRAGGGDPDLPGPPIEPDGGAHWVGAVCDLMGGSCSYGPAGIRINSTVGLSLAALADMGYTVDMTKAAPWGRNAAAAMAEGFRDVVTVRTGPGVPRR